MNTFETTLGLETSKGAIAFPISFSIEPQRRAVTPAKNVKLYAVNVYSIRLKTDTKKLFKTAKMASEYIEQMNKTGIFLTNIIK